MNATPRPTPGLTKFLRRRSLGGLLVWLSLLVGVLTPWCVGIGIKVYLDLHDRPTWNWMYFLHPGHLLFELWATFWYALPAIAIALLTYILFSGRYQSPDRFNPLEKSLIVLSGLAWGSIASVPVFIRIFWKFDPVVMVFPFFVTAAYAGQYVLGLLAGLVLALSSYFFRTGIHHG